MPFVSCMYGFRVSEIHKNDASDKSDISEKSDERDENDKKNKSDKNDRSDRSDGMEQEKGSKSGDSTGLYKDEQRTRKVVESDRFERPVSTYSMHAHFHQYSSCGIGTTVQMDGKVDLQRCALA